MSWPQIVLIAYFTFSVIAVVSGIGKTREPITPRLAANAVVISAALIVLVAIA